jgi:hypothetical protein
VTRGLLQGHQVKAISLFLLDDPGRFDHAGVAVVP